MHKSPTRKPPARMVIENRSTKRLPIKHLLGLYSRLWIKIQEEFVYVWKLQSEYARTGLLEHLDNRKMCFLRIWPWRYLLLWLFTSYRIAFVIASESIVVSKAGLALSSPFHFSDSKSNLTVNAEIGSESIIHPTSAFSSHVYLLDVSEYRT